MKHAGFTLLELIMTTVLALVLALMAIPSWQNTLNKIRARSQINQLHLLLQSARQQAIAYGLPVVVCPSNDQLHCTQDWQHRLFVFIDRSNTGQIISSEILAQLQLVDSTREQLVFNGNVIAFNSQGMSGFNNGTLTYCLLKDAHLGAKIIVSRVGRVRVERSQGEICG